MKKYLMLIFILLNLTACGGGGGDDKEPLLPLTLSPAMLTTKVEAGEKKYLAINAILNTEFNGYIEVLEPTGTINPEIQVITNPDGTYTAQVSTSTTLLPGVYEGRITVKLCNDIGCKSQIVGSPSYVDFNIEVTSDTNFTTLVTWPNVNNWETFQSNPAHTGYVPVTLDVNKFSQRWRWSTGEKNHQISPAVVANGVLYFSDILSNKLHALNEYDASEKWQHSFMGTLNPPAVTDGQVFVATTGYQDSFMWGFSADMGRQQFKTAFLSQWPNFYAPTVDSGVVYSAGGYYGGLNSFNTTDGTKLWHTDLGYRDKWTPAIDETNAYVFMPETCSLCENAGLTIVNKMTGSIIATISDPYYDHDWRSIDDKGSPVIGSNHDVFVVNKIGSPVNEDRTNHLISFNTESLSINWALPGTFRTNPAFAKGVVYATNNSPLQLEARDELSGSLLWTWTPPTAYDAGRDFYGNIIVTDNIVFVSTDTRVYAININSHDEVWNYKKGGELTLSNNGVLYINTTTPNVGRHSDGAIVAINLK